MRKAVCGITLVLLLSSILSSALIIHPVKAEWTGTVYIRADGSIDPADAPITTYDNITYTLTDNITSSTSGIIIERDNIIFDGGNHTLQGAGEFAQIGIDLYESVNVTIKNIIIVNFDIGVYLNNSTNNLIRNNYLVTNDYAGIMLDKSSSNTISENVFLNCGLDIFDSYNNVVINNMVNDKLLVYLEGVSDLTVSDAGQVILLRCNNIKVENLSLSKINKGIQLWQTNNTLISVNNVTKNCIGIYLYSSSNNNISKNYIANNEIGVILEKFSNNNSVIGNDLKDNPSYGIRLIQSSCNLVSNNVISTEVESTLDIIPVAIELWDADNNSISCNNIRNYLNGIVIENYPDGLGSSNNIIVKNKVEGYNRETAVGIAVFGYGSNNNSIIENEIINNCLGILGGWTTKNTMSKNIIMNNYRGIVFGEYATEIMISENNITKNSVGVDVEGSFNIIYKNIIANNTECGLSLFGGENIIYHNSFVNNFCQADVSSYWQCNFWDIGYPSGGNYWSDYDGIDEKGGPGQDQPGSDGIGDTPYFICENNVDRYPFIKPEFPTFPVGKPFVILSASSNIVKEDVENVVFTAIAYDFDGYIESYLFDYGDGHDSGWVSDSSISWTYSNPGEYKARVKVRDDDGIESDWSYPVNITVTSINKPTAILSAYPTTVKEDVESVTFDASASYDPDGTVISYFFSFGDGSESGWVSSSKVSKVYSEPGSYLAKVKVMDNDGIESDWSNTIKITVTALPPTPPENQKPIARLSASPTTVEEDYQSVTLDASASYDPDGSVVAYWFDYGDGTNSGWITKSAVSKVYSNPGYYVVRVKVKDDKAAESDWSNTVTITVKVSPPPIIKSGPKVYPGYPEMGQTYTITIEVENPSAVAKTVWFEIKEERIWPLRDVIGDRVYPPQPAGPIQIPSKQTYKFTFSFNHDWDWMARLKEPGYGSIKWVLRLAPAPGVWSLFKTTASLMKFLVDATLVDCECVYKYTISSNIEIPEDRKEIQVKVSVPSYKIYALSNSYIYNCQGSLYTWAAVGTGLALGWTGVGLLATAALSIAEGCAYVTADMLFNMANDPPDFNFTYIVVPKGTTLPQLENIPENFTVKKLTERLISLADNLQAALISLERYQGAKLSNNTEWMIKQLDAARTFINKAIADLLEIRGIQAEAFNELRLMGVHPDPTQIVAIRDNLSKGLPQVEVEILQYLGYSNEQIDSIREVVMNAPECLWLNYNETLKMVEDLTCNLINISNNFAERENEIRTTVLNETRTLTYLVYVNKQLLSVGIESNSTITGFCFDQDQKMIRFYAEGINGTLGFCNVTIPKELLKGEPWTLMLNGTSWPFTLTENETHSFIYFTYTHISTYEVTIQGTWVIPEIPSTFILAMSMLTCLIAITLWKTKRKAPIS